MFFFVLWPCFPLQPSYNLFFCCCCCICFIFIVFFVCVQCTYIYVGLDGFRGWKKSVFFSCIRTYIDWSIFWRLGTVDWISHNNIWGAIIFITYFFSFFSSSSKKKIWQPIIIHLIWFLFEFSERFGISFSHSLSMSIIRRLFIHINIVIIPNYYTSFEGTGSFNFAVFFVFSMNIYESDLTIRI